MESYTLVNDILQLTFISDGLDNGRLIVSTRPCGKCRRYVVTKATNICAYCYPESANYYLGNSCARCGENVRYTSSRSCVRCVLESSRRRRAISTLDRAGDFTNAHLPPILRNSNLKPVTNRPEAIAKGLVNYTSSEPCKRCGRHDRYTRSGGCVTCGLLRKFSTKAA